MGGRSGGVPHRRLPGPGHPGGSRVRRRALRRQRGVGLTVMVATRLHSIATGNILPASVPLVCVDINPATVTRLAERVSGHGVGIVTDTGLFLEQLVRELIPSYGAAAVG